MILDGKSTQGNPVNARVPRHPTLGPKLFLISINNLPDDAICNIAIYADDTILYSKCDQGSDLWQKLELPSEFESDLRDNVEWGRKWLVISILEKLNLFRLTSLIALTLVLLI